VSAATPAAADTTPRATAAGPLVSRTARVSAATLTLARHRATAAGDVMVVAIAARSGPKADIVAPVGWTRVRRDSCGREGRRLTQALYAKVLVPTDPIRFSWRFGRPLNAAAGLLAYRRIDPARPITSHTGRHRRAHRPLAHSGQACARVRGRAVAGPAQGRTGRVGSAARGPARPVSSPADSAAAVSVTTAPAGRNDRPRRPALDLQRPRQPRPGQGDHAHSQR
jgi:hypothetical protein